MDEDIEVENNSFLDFNTTVSKTNPAKSPEPQKQTSKPQVIDDDGFEMMTELNSDCEIILNYEVLVTRNHPILEVKATEIEKNAAGCTV